MRKKMLEILACPICKSHPLELSSGEERGDEVISGNLRCTRCGLDFTIDDGIPNLLPPEKCDG